jgi:predicted alpha/beta superfamily hydrolase
VFISVGENEHKVMVKDATRLKEKLVALDRSKLAVDFEIMKGENHASILHQSVYSSLLKLFPLKK